MFTKTLINMLHEAKKKKSLHALRRTKHSTFMEMIDLHIAIKKFYLYYRKHSRVQFIEHSFTILLN